MLYVYIYVYVSMNIQEKTCIITSENVCIQVKYMYNYI